MTPVDNAAEEFELSVLCVSYNLQHISGCRCLCPLRLPVRHRWQHLAVCRVTLDCEHLAPAELLERGLSSAWSVAEWELRLELESASGPWPVGLGGSKGER